MNTKPRTSSTLLITLICAIAFVTLAAGAFLFTDAEIRDARVKVLGR